MNINLIFNGSETRIELQATDESERKILGVILGHSSLKIESRNNDDGYTMYDRPFNEPPTSVSFFLTPPPKEWPLLSPQDENPAPNKQKKRLKRGE